MTLKEVKIKTLNHVFDWFNENRGVNTLSVWNFITEMGEDPVAITKQLEVQRLIKHRVVSRNNVKAQITVDGILEIQPDYFDGFRDKLLIALMQSENQRVLLLESLGLEYKDMDFARYIADYMMDNGLARVDFNQKNGVVTLSPRGREFYEDNQAGFL